MIARAVALVLTAAAMRVWAITAASAADLPEDYPAQPAPDWDAVFQRSEGWTGGDDMYSLPLPGERVLWLFADSWIGPVVDGQHAPGTRMVNNVLAIHPSVSDSQPPAADQVRFFWGTPPEEAEPLAWIRPVDRPGEWYWPADAVVAGQPPRLILFLWRLRRNNAPGAFGFESSGGNVALVENPGQDPPDWRIAQFENPHTVASGGREGISETSWGSELVVDGEHLLIYGIREQPLNKRMMLARTRPETVEDFASWEFRTERGWSPRLADARPLAGAMVNEFTLTPTELAGEKTWLLVQSEPLFGDHVQVRVSRSPLGPFSNAQNVYRVPGVVRDQTFTYAHKAHPELSRPGELLITYVINAFDFGAAVRDADLYRPRFLRLPLAAVKPPAAR